MGTSSRSGRGGEGPERIDADDVVEVPAPSRPYTTEFVVGTSSAAPAAVFEEAPLGITSLDELPPEAPYWPIREGAVPPSRPYAFGDGGNLENYGLISMLIA